METSPDALLVTPGSESVGLRAAREIGYGSIAGMISKVFEHPFDLTKVRLQSQVLDSTARFSGPIDCLTQTWRKEGFRGLYRGLPAPIVGAMAENASLFLVYGELQNLIRRTTNRPVDEKLPLQHIAISAAGAGAVTSFLLTPIELVKCKMQVQMLAPTTSTTPRVLPGPISVFTNVIRTQGLRGLWLGHTGTFIRESGGTAAWFSTKEYVASRLIKRRTSTQDDGVKTVASTQLRPWESAVSGAVAGAAFNLALFPADTVKSAMQTEEELRPVSASSLSVKEKPSFGRTFLAMYRAQGIRGLYAGCGITVARSIPSSAIIFLIYDGLKKHLG